MLIGKRSDGSDIPHEFDIVSVGTNLEFDGKILGEVKSDIFGSENGYRSTRFCRMITACLYLERSKAERKFLVLTDKEFHSRLTKDVDGLISKEIEVLFLSIGPTNNKGK